MTDTVHSLPRPIAAIMALAGLCLGGAPSASAACIDLRLILAIDSSGSIDAAEYALQIEGYALALRDPRVLRAIDGAGQVEIGVILWADNDTPLVVLPPRRVDEGDGLETLVQDLATSGRAAQGSTGIGRAIDAAATLADQGACARRRVIDVSGDGRESRRPRPVSFLPLWLARQRVQALGITVNGLSIGGEDRMIRDYYLNEVITGPDAFAMHVDDWTGFAVAIRDKLMREIRLPQMASAD
ncbi:DUF1194 domain-containing protein [Neotabrizicola shimadae]|uniref:DUF1194 domain-containing protein n=1 Tax=Neotabrizicola shimadae TaxID=2807096 RepID=A0A8G0ZXL5_9RHOB|nr:DUF1194 domain-containing protein [Neotabrizicola shimadae]QYZ70590.1 DUF1194 domain-containing protein [Neotabrizicola shimadae]